MKQINTQFASSKLQEADKTMKPILEEHKRKMEALENDIKIIEGLLSQEKAPSMRWEISQEEALCWDAALEKVTFHYKDQYMILQFATKNYQAHAAKYMDEFFEKLKTQTQKVIS